MPADSQLKLGKSSLEYQYVDTSDASVEHNSLQLKESITNISSASVTSGLVPTKTISFTKYDSGLDSFASYTTGTKFEVKTAAIDMDGVTTISNDTAADGSGAAALVASGGIHAAKASYFAAAVEANGALTANDTASIAGVTTISANVAGTSEGSGALKLSSGGLYSSGASYFADAVTSNGALTANDTASITGVTTISASVAGASNSSGALRLTAGGLYSAAASYFAAAVEANGALTANDTTTIAGVTTISANVAGTSEGSGALRLTQGGLYSSGASYFKAALTASGALTASSTALIAGVTTITNDTAGDTNQGALVCSGGIFAAKACRLEGITTMSDVIISGNLTVQGTRNTVSTTDLIVKDQFIQLNTVLDVNSNQVTSSTADVDGRSAGLVMSGNNKVLELSYTGDGSTPTLRLNYANAPTSDGSTTFDPSDADQSYSLANLDANKINCSTLEMTGTGDNSMTYGPGSLGTDANHAPSMTLIGGMEIEKSLYVHSGIYVGANSAGWGGRMLGDLSLSGSLMSNSDERLKTDIQPETATVDKLRPVTFKWKADDSKSGRVNHGFIAQELREVLPELVRGDPETEMLSVSYTEIVSILVKEVQDLKTEVSSLKEQLSA